jgi:hypothetical protein
MKQYGIKPVIETEDGLWQYIGLQMGRIQDSEKGGGGGGVPRTLHSSFERSFPNLNISRPISKNFQR